MESTLSRLLRTAPLPLEAPVAGRMLTAALRTPLDDGELAFLHGRRVAIAVTDLGLERCVILDHDRLRIERGHHADVRISGRASAFLDIALRREDPDSLFFERRLMIEGDTELGLQVKNLLDAVDHASLPRPLLALLELLGRWHPGTT